MTHPPDAPGRPLDHNGANPFAPGERRWLLLSLVLGAVYWALQGRLRPPAGVALKWLPIGLLTALAWGRRRQRGGRWLFVALVSHGIGDIVLGWNRAWIPCAIPPFLLGHLGYARAFWPWRRPWRAWSRRRRKAALGVPALALGTAALLLPHLSGPLLLAVVVYIAAISVMGVLALAADLGSERVSAGGLAYMLSDALIGLDAFVAPIPGGAYVTWPLYYGAQALITTGYLAGSAAAPAQASLAEPDVPRPADQEEI